MFAALKATDTYPAVAQLADLQLLTSHHIWVCICCR